jgi:hypothetical protein
MQISNENEKLTFIDPVTDVAPPPSLVDERDERVYIGPEIDVKVETLTTFVFLSTKYIELLLY